MKRLLLFLLGTNLLLVAIPAQEYRGGLSAEFRLFPRLEAEMEIELRKIFIPESYFNRTFQGSLGYELSSRWSIGATYSYAIITEKEEDENEGLEEAWDRNRLAVDLEFQARRFDNDLRISNRFRYQVSTVEDDEPSQYFRNRVMLDYKISQAMNPYFAVEPYYRFDEQEVNVIRFYIGNEMPVFRSKIDLYYIAELHFHSEYTTAQYIVGFKIELDFKK